MLPSAPVKSACAAWHALHEAAVAKKPTVLSGAAFGHRRCTCCQRRQADCDTNGSAQLPRLSNRHGRLQTSSASALRSALVRRLPRVQELVKCWLCASCCASAAAALEESSWRRALSLLGRAVCCRIRGNVICTNAATSACAALLITLDAALSATWLHAKEGAGQWRDALQSFSCLRHAALQPDLLSALAD